MSTTRSTFQPPMPHTAAHVAQARHRTESIAAYRRRTRLYPLLTRIGIVALIALAASLATFGAPHHALPADTGDSVQVFDMQDRAQNLEVR